MAFGRAYFHPAKFHRGTDLVVDDDPICPDAVPAKLVIGACIGAHGPAGLLDGLAAFIELKAATWTQSTPILDQGRP